MTFYLKHCPTVRSMGLHPDLWKDVECSLTSLEDRVEHYHQLVVWDLSKNNNKNDQSIMYTHLFLTQGHRSLLEPISALFRQNKQQKLIHTKQRQFQAAVKWFKMYFFVIIYLFIHLFLLNNTQPALKVEGENGTPSFEEISGFHIIHICKKAIAIQRSTIDCLIVLIYKYRCSNHTRIVPDKVICLYKVHITRR